jgi:hypothetical protein
MDSAEAKLISEQLGRIADQLTSRINQLDERLKHQAALDGERVTAIRSELADLRESSKDHEARIRLATDGVTQFKVWSGLGSGFSGMVSIAAFIKSFIP